MTFRMAAEEDCTLILRFIRALAAYEKMSDQVVATEELLREWIFQKRKAEVLFVCEDNAEVGFALFFHNFSTFLGRAGIWLEDLFVLPEYRGKGYGRALLAKLAAEASVTGEEEIVLNARDRAAVGQKVVDAANAKLSGGKLTLSADTGDFKGGLILRRGSIEANCTAELLVELRREDMAAELAKVLFG